MHSVNAAYLEPESQDAGRARFWLERIRPDLDRTWGAFDRHELEDAGADVVIDRIEELPELLARFPARTA